MTRDIRIALLWAGAMIATTLIAVLLRKQGMIDQETVIRTVAMNGLMIAYYGNQTPKKIAPSPNIGKLARFSGWSSVITGLIYAGFWAFAPINIAMIFGTGAVALGVVATLVYAHRLKVLVKA